MRFYDALQYDPMLLKAKIQEKPAGKERRRLQFALVFRSFLIVAFAIALLSPISALFGSENTPMGVVLFCILLSVRFVDFGYRIQDALRNLGLTLLLLLFVPVLAASLPPIPAGLLHFAAFFSILLMTAQVPEMGNGGLYGFAYMFLTGNPVSGSALAQRCLLTLAGFLLCGAVFFFKHAGKHKTRTFRQVLTSFSLSSPVSRWQLRLALGSSLLLVLCQLLSVQRFMWAGFACASLLSIYPTSEDAKQRFQFRIQGAVAGSLLFSLFYLLTAPSLRSLLGPAGGLLLGLSTHYRTKTICNCFGALLLAVSIYGVQGAVILRVLNNLLGAAFGYGFVCLFRRCVDQRYLPLPATETIPVGKR
ncbi:MAG: FUSC family protein [Evtepia sp.]|uniref:FUSC family protein n=1 Tax=Evtepia sp. TaxID=2773933 RepID=UPI002A7617D1|nr:FUSC family protein [Evtepia sp.]MDY3014158.1 FUSC family protein [Evtepia sp.]